ncbi:MAG: hypothetical protein Q4B48_00610 [Syntrophomonadaceae bacterium]|nr:hypothetical protein [Syntrophomonadaceae bacterium]
MLQLDFAYWHLLPSARQGMARGMNMPEWLAPFFLAPRLKQLLRFEGLAWQGAEMLLPAGPAQWQGLTPELRRYLWRRSTALLPEYGLPLLAVDRRLKGLFKALSPPPPITFGDAFMTALALVWTEQMLEETKSARRIMVVAAQDDLNLPELLLRLHGFGLPLALQSPNPIYQEAMLYRLLYHHGAAVSNHLIDPHGWSSDTLVLQWGGPALPPAPCRLRLADDSLGLAPALESRLQAAGLSGELYQLAPIMEANLFRQCRVPPGEQTVLDFLLQSGTECGVWQAFLDKRQPFHYYINV